MGQDGSSRVLRPSGLDPVAVLDSGLRPAGGGSAQPLGRCAPVAHLLLRVSPGAYPACWFCFSGGR